MALCDDKTASVLAKMTLSEAGMSLADGNQAGAWAGSVRLFGECRRRDIFVAGHAQEWQPRRGGMAGADFGRCRSDGAGKCGWS